MSRAELTRLLDLEEEAYFESHAQGTDLSADQQAHPGQQGEERPEAPAITTLMVRHVACKLTAAQIRTEIDARGFKDSYNFFYLPLFRTHRSNQGYFFVNFKQAKDAEKFTEQMHGRPLGDSAKLCHVCAAECQGLPELYELFGNKRVMKFACRPQFL